MCVNTEQAPKQPMLGADRPNTRDRDSIILGPGKSRSWNLTQTRHGERSKSFCHRRGTKTPSRRDREREGDSFLVESSRYR